MKYQNEKQSKLQIKSCPNPINQLHYYFKIKSEFKFFNCYGKLLKNWFVLAITFLIILIEDGVAYVED